jgi:predicted HicB family RNase H-like nuclease
MAVSNDKTRTIISLEKDLKAKLENLAQQEDRSFNNYVVKILKDRVQSIEDKDKE